jgi:gliding motility-associated-like protein
MKYLSTLILICSSLAVFGQYGDCSNPVDACTNPSFEINPGLPGNNVVDFTSSATHNISNPTTNPNAQPGNAGCLLSGELNPTWLLITVTSNGTLEFSMGSPAGSGGCYDWSMWSYNANTCAGISGNTQPPVACNWNGACDGFTGMAMPGNLPTGASQGDFEHGLNVTAGQQYIICFSNYSSQSTQVPLNFYGTAQVTCGATSDAQICAGDTATVTASGGLSYNWTTSTPGFIGTNADGTEAYVNPSVTTTYNVAITLVNNTVTNATLVVEVYPPINPIVNTVHETCQGDNDGSISVTATNASGTVTYTLSGQASATNSTGTFTNLAPGNYTIDIVDGNGCTATGSTTVNAAQPCCTMTLTASATNASCFEQCNGSVTVNVVDNSSPNTFQWFLNGTAITGATNATYNNACAGAYTVQVVDQLCTLLANTTVTQPAELILTSTSNSLNCFQNASGSISLTVTNGTAPYQYSINAGSSFQASGTFNGLAADTYSLLVQDANGCQKTGTITLTQPSELTATSNVTNSLCNVFNAPCSGSIQITANGGIAPYIYNWNNGLPNNSTVDPLCQGIYNVTVVDQNGCTLPLTNLIVTEPPVVNFNGVSPTNPTCHNGCDGLISVNATGASSFTLNGEPAQNTGEFSNLCSGNYLISLADANGCGINQIVTLANPEPVIADFTFGPQPSNILNSEVNFTSTSYNAQGTYWYTFINDGYITIPGITASINFPEDIPNNYEVCLVAITNNVCMDTLCQTIIIEDVFYIFVPNAFTPNGNGVNDTFYPIVNNFDPQNFEMLIFNRWGQVIYRTESPTNGWQGIHNGEPCEAGVYLWKINTRELTTGDIKTFTGHVTIVR